MFVNPLFYLIHNAMILLLLHRDIVEVRMDLQGIPCIIRDTAGLRPEEGTIDEIEKEGMRRARDAMRKAQIKIIVSDASDPISTQV